MIPSSKGTPLSAIALALTTLLLAFAQDHARAEAVSANYRLIGSAPAGTAAVATSPQYRIYLVGAGGEPVGISASPNTSVNAGGTSNQLPTDRLFRDGAE